MELNSIYEWIIDRDNFKDFIWPIIIFWGTIIVSVWLSKIEFQRSDNSRKNELENNNSQFNEIIRRNIKTATPKLLKIKDELNKLIAENYHIEKTITPVKYEVNVIEIDFLKSIELNKFEEVFLDNRIDESKINTINNIVKAINIISRSINSINKEFEKIELFNFKQKPKVEYDYVIFSDYLFKLLDNPLLEKNYKEKIVNRQDVEFFNDCLLINNEHTIQKYLEKFDLLESTNIFKNYIQPNFILDFLGKRNKLDYNLFLFKNELLIFELNVKKHYLKIENSIIELQALTSKL